MKTLSLRLKIALLSTLISATVLIAFGASSWYLLYRQKVEAVDTEIRALGMRHPGWLANRANFSRFNASLEFIFGEERKGSAFLLVKDAQGEVLYTSPGFPAGLKPETIDCALEDAAPSTGMEETDSSSGSAGPPWGQGAGSGRGGGRGFGPMGRGTGGPVVFNKRPKFLTMRTSESLWRLGILGNDELRFVVGLNYDSVQADMNRLRNIFLASLPLALVLVGGGGWLVAGHALRPLRRIARTAEQVTAQGLDQRIPSVDEDPEIGRLIQVLNGMMDRLATSFRQATRFSADASHELKTPLSIMQGELEQAVQNAAPGSAEQRTFGNLLEETHRLKRITGSLLLLAQADAGQLKLTLEEIPLSDDLAGLIEDAQAWAADANIRLQVHCPAGVKLRGDRGLLRMALMNLITNAFRYNERGGSVELALNPGEEIELTVCNTGPGIRPADQPHIFDRFYRAKQAATQPKDGLGLGLSLAREIIQAHHGRLALQESRPGRTCFVVMLKQDPTA